MSEVVFDDVTKQFGTSSPSTTSTSRSSTTSSWCSSVRRAAARPRRCAWSPGSSRSHGVDPHRRPRGQRRRGQGPQRLDGLPELRALPAHDRRQEHRVSVAGAQVRGRRRATSPASSEDRTSRASRRRGTQSGTDRAAEPQAGSAVGRPAPACRPRPSHRQPPRGVPDGRAPVEPRRQAASPDPPRARRAPSSGWPRRSST